MTDKDQSQLLSPSIRKRIDEWVLRYPPENKSSGVFEALRLVQDENNGYLSTELMDEVADYLDMPRIAVYEVVSFYTMYHAHKVGKYIIDVCTNVSCMLNGSEKIVEHLRKRLGVDVDETTPDRKFTLNEVECLGACIAAPVCQIGKTFYENLTPEKMDEILNKL